MSRSDTPSWPPQQSLSPTSPSRSKMTTFPPPGAMEPAVPGLSPNISRPAHPASSITRSDHGDRNYSGQRMPSGGGMGEFGVSSHPQQAQSSSSSSRRALPTQPPSLMSSAMTQNGSFGTARRPLPTPPGAGPPSSRPVEAPISTPRPTVPTELPPATYRRALPILPHPPPSSTRQTSDADAPPPPPPRPLPNISSYFPTAASNPVIPRNSLKGKSVPAGLGRQPSDRVSVLREDLYDSPISLITSNSSPGEYSTFAGPSRQSSQSKSLYHSSSASSFELTSSSHGASTNETQPTSVATSNTGHEAWQPTLDKFEEAEGSGTNVTIRPPSRGPPISPSLVDGRETPTPTERRTGQPPLASLASGSHERHISSSTIGATDADLHETPNVMPTRMLQQRSFVDGLRDILKFPAPDDGEGEPSMSLHSASTSRDSITSDASSGECTPFPEPHPNAPRRQISNRSSLHPQSLSSFNSRPSTELSPSWSQQSRPPAHWVERKLQIHALNEGDLGGDPSLQNEYEDEDAEWGEEEEEEAEVNEIHFFQPAFLSEAALQLKYRIERRRQTKAGITWHSSFTGRDIVVGFPILTLGGFAEASQRTIQDFLPSYSRDSSSDRRFALITAQSLQDQLWFVEVDWDIKPLRDSSEDVFRFMGEMEGMGAGEGLTTELPSGLMTMATRCYSPSCTGDARCYSPRCPFRTNPDSFLGKKETTPVPTPVIAHEGDWTQDVDPLVLRSLNAQQYSRQTVIRQAIQSEVQYEADLSSMEKLFIDGLRRANPPIITPSRRLESFIFEVFSNAHELHEACRRLIDNFAIRERESAQRPLILSVGDIFLEAATEFRNMYPQYTGHLPQAENVLKKELDSNPEFRLFCEVS